MASLPGGSNKDDKGESRRDRAVARYMVPILVGWLLAVAGLIYWNSSIPEILEKAGKVAVLTSAALAFLTVVLAAVQDMLRVEWKQRLLFPRIDRKQRPRIQWSKRPYPSSWAFSLDMMKKAELKGSDFEGLQGFDDGLPGDDEEEKQGRLWYAAYLRHKDEPAIGQFSARHIAWRDAVPLMILLTILTPIAGALTRFPQGFAAWGWLFAACFGLGWMCWFAGRGANTGLVIEVLKRLAREPRKEAPSLSSSPPSTAPILATGLAHDQQ